MHKTIFAVYALLLPSICLGQTTCGEVVTLPTHDATSTRFALANPSEQRPQEKPIALVLLPGGPGFVDLDSAGCARMLKGNSLIRSIPIFRSMGFFTALVDAPSDHHGEDGLGGFRIDPQHAEDLGKIIVDLRARTKAPVWIVGTSRGSISAVNAAARLAGSSAPDGIVLTSALMTGQARAKKSWVTQSVFDLPLEAIRMPVLVVGHAEDSCIRSPAKRMDEITARTNSTREQTMTVTGGPGGAGLSGIAACEGRSPHGFIGQEAEVAAGIARFIRGGKY